MDIMWYIWSNENSPVYGKEKMATFERYFIEDKAVQDEKKNEYVIWIVCNYLQNTLVGELQYLLYSTTSRKIL